MLQQLIESLVPIILSELDKVVDNKSGNRSAWVGAVVNEVLSLLSNKIPSWIKADEAKIVTLIEDAVSKYLKI